MVSYSTPELQFKSCGAAQKSPSLVCVCVCVCVCLALFGARGEVMLSKLHFTLLHVTLCMYMHRFTLVYIYIYIYTSVDPCISMHVMYCCSAVLLHIYR